MKKENLQPKAARPTYELIQHLAFEGDERQEFNKTRSTALFTICLLSLTANPKGYDALDAFADLFRLEQIDSKTKEEALASLAIVANNSGPELQEEALRTVRELDCYVNDDNTWMREDIGGRVAYTLATMSKAEPINGYINGQLTSVIDFDIVVERRKAALA